MANLPERLMVRNGTYYARLVALARRYAAATGDREFASRAELFSNATQDPARFWKGEFGALPSPVDFGHGEEDGYTYFDHLVGEGDLEKVLGFINLFRLGRRISDLQSMKAIGNLGEFAALADQLLPGLSRPDAIVLARLLIDEELAALRAVANGEGEPSAQLAEPTSPMLAPAQR